MPPELNPDTAAQHQGHYKNAPDERSALFDKMRRKLGDALGEVYDLSDGEIKMLNGIPDHVVSDMIDSINRAHEDPNGKISFERGESSKGPKWEFIHHVVVTPDSKGGPHHVQTHSQTRCFK